MTFPVRIAAVLLLILSGPLVRAAPAAAVPVDTGTAGAAAIDPLQRLGWHVTTGAAAGYLKDEVCGSCHAALYRSYQHVGMAQSFASAADATRIEAYGRTFHHVASDRYYRIDRQGDRLVFHRWQQGADGRPINRIDIDIDWIVGSGNRARSYLYQNARGEMFMLPLSWYSESSSWGMSPGFEGAAQEGLTRQIQRPCMFCHNAFPQVPKGSDVHWAPQVFPHELPQGTGCQRCHGPGAEHVRQAVSGKGLAEVRAAIVNPAKLPVEQRDSVCFQCHMLPSARVVGPRRFDRTDYSFRPGERLDDYILNVAVTEQGVAPADQFEINHHGYRLFESRCYQQSRGALTCISCHDPHVKPESGAFRAKVGKLCIGCHAAPATLHQPDVDLAGTDCVTCHMPTRRTSDVVQVTMTDHRIARGPFDHQALVAPRAATLHPVTGIELLDFGEVPTGDAATEALSIAALRASRSVAPALAGLERVLDRGADAATTPQLDAIRGELQTGRFPAAEQRARHLLAARPDLAVGHTLLGIALLAQDRTSAAVAALQRSVALEDDPETRVNLALAQLRAGDADGARQSLDAAIEMRPTLARAWKYRALLRRSDGDLPGARAALERAIALDPLDVAGMQDLIDLLRQLGDLDAARRWLELGRRTSQQLSGSSGG